MVAMVVCGIMCGRSGGQWSSRLLQWWSVESFVNAVSVSGVVCG